MGTVQVSQETLTELNTSIAEEAAFLDEIDQLADELEEEFLDESYWRRPRRGYGQSFLDELAELARKAQRKRPSRTRCAPVKPPRSPRVRSRARERRARPSARSVGSRGDPSEPDPDIDERPSTPRECPR
jgi:hypothetical protein